MFKYLLAALLSVVLFYSGLSQVLSIAFIPDSLLKNADAVKRLDEQVLEIRNIGEAVLSNRVAYTILNENADHLAEISEYYNSFREIRRMEATLFDAMGREIRSMKRSDLKDESASDDNNIKDDTRSKSFSFFHKVYPYTVLFETEVKMNGTMFLPGWYALEGERISVVSSSYKVVHPADYVLRYKMYNYAGQPQLAEEKSAKTLLWKQQNLPAVLREYAAPPWYEITPAVFLSPKEFEMEKFRGSMESWQSFGRFTWQLKQGRDVLPAATKATVHELADHLPDPRQKIAALYKYMQDNTRYVSIQLGIGGWQPYDAAYVAERRYGDCKALVNFMYTLLKEAGINSYYTLVKAGEGASWFIEDWPSSQFNHVILCVPLQKDTMWLECTSQTQQVGYMGSFTCSRPALLVDENNSRLVRTPHYSKAENLQARTVTGTIDATGNGQLKASAQYTGLLQEKLHNAVLHLSAEKLLDYRKRTLDLPTYDIGNYSCKPGVADAPLIQEDMDLQVPHLAQVSGKRLFVQPNLLTKWDVRLKTDSTRRYDVNLLHEYRFVDSVVLTIPDGYTAEAIPKEKVLQSKFGNYRAWAKVNGNVVTYYRLLETNSGRYPAPEFNSLAAFYADVYKADRAQVVFVKNEALP